MLSILTYSRGNVLSELGSERPKLVVAYAWLLLYLTHVCLILRPGWQRWVHSITSRRFQPKREGTLLWHCSAERSIWTALERKRATKDFCSLLKGYVCEIVYLVEGIWDKSRLGKCVWAGTSRGAVAGSPYFRLQQQASARRLCVVLRPGVVVTHCTVLIHLASQLPLETPHLCATGCKEMFLVSPTTRHRNVFIGVWKHLNAVIHILANNRYSAPLCHV